MDITTLETLLTAAGIACFCAASLLALAGLLRQHPPEEAEPWVSRLLALGFAPLLALIVWHGVRAGGVPLFNRFDALTVYGLCITAAYLLMSARRKQGVSAFLAPYVTLILVAGAATVHVKAGPPPGVPGIWLMLHLCTAFASYSLFSLASILAVVYLVQVRNLKKGRFGVVFERLPALETLDLLMFRQVGFAFVLLTLSIVLGFFLVHLSGSGPEWITDPKVAATLITWALYAVLVHMRASAGQHGTRVAMVTALGLCLVLFTLIGVHFVSDSVHGFIQMGKLPG
jgi:ABC-type transport system involved in cytochrome c biogenesis permease subunit